MEHPRADTHAPDFGVRVLGAEAFRCGKDIVINDIRSTINVDGYDFPPMGHFDVGTDVSLVSCVAAPSGFLSE